jgi:putative FmdB family regulatory protein
MPLFDYQCMNCGKVSELLLKSSSDSLQCTFCGSLKLKKIMAAHSSLSGASQAKLPGEGDTGCCGVTPHKADCEGPGSCCGKGR